MVQSNDIQTLHSAIQYYRNMRVADYQRNYTWAPQDVEDLYRDILDLLDEPTDTHFLGSLILQNSGENDASLECEVVDGQQRLTTLFLLVGRIRDEVQGLSNYKIEPQIPNGLPIDVLAQIREFLYVPGAQVVELKFRSNSLLQDMFFNNMLKEKPRPEPPGRDAKLKDLSLPLRKSYRKCEALIQSSLEDVVSKVLPKDQTGYSEVEIEDLADSAKLNFLHKLFLTIRDRVKVLLVSTASIRESLDVFVTLNARGVPLGPSDLVRGQVLENLTIGKNEKESLNIFATNMNEWRQVLDNIGDGDSEQFFRHFLVAISTDKVTKKNIVDVAIRRMRQDVPQQQLIKTHEFWGDLLEASEAYKTILRPDNSKKYAYHLKVLRRISASYRVLLLTMFNPGNQLSENDLAEIVRLCYVLVFRYFGAGKNAQDLENFFAKTSHTYRKDKNVAHVISSLSKEGEISFDISSYLDSGIDSTNWSKAILHGLDEVLRGLANSIPFDTNTLHLEHVAPQTATAAWGADLFSGVKYSDEQYDTLVDSLGNQTLLDERLNKAAKQDQFSIKRSKYKTSVVSITQDLDNVDKWDKGLVAKRLEWLTQTYDQVFNVIPLAAVPPQFSVWLKSQP